MFEDIDPLARLEAVEHNAELITHTLQQQYEFNRMLYNQVVKLIDELNSERNRNQAFRTRIQRIEQRLSIIEELKK